MINTELVNISVGLRLDPNEMMDFKSRNERILDILLERSKTVVVKITDNTAKNGYTEIEYRASIPRQTMGHHNFDSKLNKSWPEGAGAGWVEEL